MNYDIIGDIHGHADALKQLLIELGYREHQGAWRRAGSQAIFVGDFIDRGPKQVETVEIVRRMVDAGSAQAIMGNHELNAIAWFLPDGTGEHLRRHTQKNRHQHQAFLDAVDGTERHEQIIDWFLTLPLWLDLPGLRVVHACWHPRYMDYLAPRLRAGGFLDRDLVAPATREPDDAAEKDNAEPSVFKATEALLKGLEIPLPAPHSFQDPDGHARTRVRVRWWDRGAVTYRSAALLPDATRAALPDAPIPDHVRVPYPTEKPLFFGHYWMSGRPLLLADTVACLDYSIARGGKLVAYSWEGEPRLDESKFRHVV